jgi:CheY-like chemotaxis protein
LIELSRSTMERQLGQMVRLVDDLIDVSRISRNKLELRKEKVELASIIHHAVEACRPLAERANHELVVSVPSEPIYLNADSARLAQAFGNLLTNSCKFTNPGGRIELTVERNGQDALVMVTDNGIGIPPDMLGKIFEMFMQIDQSLERSQSGLGIGLTLVKRLVEMHDGEITANSRGKGYGSEFVVRLPVLDAVSTLSSRPESPSDSAPTDARRILVVDDNRDSAMSLAMLLRLIGNDVQTAHDGLDAVRKAESFRPELILLDIGLPKLNGYAACGQIRSQSWGQDMVIVALTGWGQEEDRRKSKEAGFDKHLVKPVAHAALVQLLAETKNL